MAQDATGTPSTNYGIPKFNTAVDAPSGKGNNAIVDSIDSIIPFAKSIVTTKGDLVAATASATFARLGIGTDGQVLTADAASGPGMKWATSTSGMSFGTALPGSPSDGDLFILTDSTSAPTYQWLLRYVAAKASNKWVCIGGVPLEAEVATAETTTSTTYTALTTAGPNVVVPVAGDYFVEQGFTLIKNQASSEGWMSYDIGGTGAVDADGVFAQARYTGTSNENVGNSVMRRKKKAALTAVTLTSKYRQEANAGSAASFQNRWMSLMPIAIGG